MRTPQLADNLRRAVLQAAIAGKLNDRTNENARDLLAAIQTEKAAQQKTGSLKKAKPLAPINEEEIPFAIPENWVWVRLGEIAEYKKGPFGSPITKSMFIPKGNGAIKVYEQKNTIKKDASLGTYYISKQYFEEKLSGFEVKAGDILVSCAGTIGESYILPDKIEKGIINQALMRIRTIEQINKYMFLLVFDYAIKAAKASAKGTAIKNIPPFEILKNLLIPLPPPHRTTTNRRKTELPASRNRRTESARTSPACHTKRLPKKTARGITTSGGAGRTQRKNGRKRPRPAHRHPGRKSRITKSRQTKKRQTACRH